MGGPGPICCGPIPISDVIGRSSPPMGGRISPWKGAPFCGAKFGRLNTGIGTDIAWDWGGPLGGNCDGIFPGGWKEGVNGCWKVFTFDMGREELTVGCEGTEVEGATTVLSVFCGCCCGVTCCICFTGGGADVSSIGWSSTLKNKEQTSAYMYMYLPACTYIVLSHWGWETTIYSPMLRVHCTFSKRLRLRVSIFKLSEYMYIFLRCWG